MKECYCSNHTHTRCDVCIAKEYMGKKINNNFMGFRKQKKESEFEGRKWRYWIDAEINFIHVLLYIIMGLQTGGYWWILFGSLTTMSLVGMISQALKSRKKE